MNTSNYEKMLNDLSVKKDDYTVIVMLKDRELFTKRWLNYMRFIKFPFKIFIADGSLGNSVRDYIRGNNKLKDLDIEYIRYSHDATYSEYYKKMADALARIKTKYVSLSDNDDFYIVEGIAKSIAFLKNNSDYASCRGEVSTIAVFDKKNKCLYGRVGGIRYKCYRGVSVEDEKSSERIIKHLTKYDPTFYDVHKTEILKACFEKLNDISPENIILAECLTSCMTVTLGKIKRLPCLYYIRQANSPGSSSYAESIKYDFFDRMLLRSWSHDFTESAKAVSEIISQKDGVTIDEAVKIFKVGYKRMVGPNIIWSMNRERVLAKKNIFQQLVFKILCMIGYARRSYLWRRLIDKYGLARKNINTFSQVVKFLNKGYEKCN
jgi:glycosyltransferase domain-containing protein